MLSAEKSPYRCLTISALRRVLLYTMSPLRRFLVLALGTRGRRTELSAIASSVLYPRPAPGIWQPDEKETNSEPSGASAK